MNESGAAERPQATLLERKDGHSRRLLYRENFSEGQTRAAGSGGRGREKALDILPEDVRFQVDGVAGLAFGEGCVTEGGGDEVDLKPSIFIGKR